MRSGRIWTVTICGSLRPNCGSVITVSLGLRLGLGLQIVVYKLLEKATKCGSITWLKLTNGDAPCRMQIHPAPHFVVSWHLPQTVPADDTLYLDARRLIEVCQLRIDVVAKAAERDDRLVFHGLRVFQHVPQTQTSSQCSTRVRVTIVWPEPTAIPLSHITYLLHSTYGPRLISSSFMWATAEAIWTACKGSRTLSAAL